MSLASRPVGQRVVARSREEHVVAQVASDRIVEMMPWLDKAAEQLQELVSPLAGPKSPQRWRDFLNGTWFGHPLHPAAVTLPIGLWAATVALDYAGEEGAADATLGWGNLTALAAVTTGVAQWVDATNDTAPRRLGTLHALTNTAALGLNCASWLARKTGQRKLGESLAIAGCGVVLAGAWLGGDLSYDLGIGINHQAFEMPPGDWEDVAAASALEIDHPVRVVAHDGAAVMLVRHEHGIHAIGAVCPHLGGPLDEGTIDGECVECPWHHSVFDLRDGRVVHGPSAAPASAYDVKIDNDRVLVRVRR